MNRASELRSLFDANDILLAPGAYDGLTARLVQLAGFSTVYATGAGISNSQFALADVGLVTMNEILEQVRKMHQAVDVPIICDVDTGYGNALNLHRTVSEFVRAGAAALQIEDQVFPKRCGHFEGKHIVSQQEAVNKIKAANEARGDSGVMIIARTDAIAVEGFDAAMQRARAYHEAGADILFVEAPRNADQMATIARELPGLKLANIVEGGHTPIVSLGDLKEMGFNLVLYANLVLRSSVLAIQNNLAHLHERGDSVDILDRMITMPERARVTRKNTLDEIERRYAEVGT